MDFRACGYQWHRSFKTVIKAIDHLQSEMRTRISKSEKTPYDFDSLLSGSLALVSSVTYERPRCRDSIEKWTCSKCELSGFSMAGPVKLFGASSLVLQIPNEFWGFVAEPQNSSALADTCLIAIRGTDGPVTITD